METNDKLSSIFILRILNDSFYSPLMLLVVCKVELLINYLDMSINICKIFSILL